MHDTFTLEAPERDILWEIDLGPRDKNVVVVGPPGSGQSILAQSLICTLGGPPVGESTGMRGLFPSLSWLGEGASATHESLITRGLRMHPYGPDDQPNFMEYTSTEERLEPVAYVGGTGGQIFIKNAKLDTTRSREVKLAFINIAHELGVQSRYSDLGQLFDDSVKYLNTVLLCPAPSVTCLIAMLSAVMTAHHVVFDIHRPGVDAETMNHYYKAVLAISDRRSVKVVSFLSSNEYQYIGPFVEQVYWRQVTN